MKVAVDDQNIHQQVQRYASLERDSQRETFPFLRAYLRSQARGHRRLPRQAELDEKIEELAQLLSSS